MPLARITSKGQITVPKAVRERLGVAPGDALEFHFEGERLAVRPVRRGRLAEFRGLFAVSNALDYAEERASAWAERGQQFGKNQSAGRCVKRWLMRMSSWATCRISRRSLRREWLQSVYQWRRQDIASGLLQLLSAAVLVVLGQAAVEQALIWYRDHPRLAFADAYVAALAVERGHGWWCRSTESSGVSCQYV